jgi:AraC-like DNA-binding protein
MDWGVDLQKAVNFMEENLLREIGVEDVACHVHVSKDYFAKIFNIITNYNVGEYIRNRRLSMAAQELAFTQATVLEVASMYMYESPESFTKAFVRLYGYTPSQVRAQKIEPQIFHPFSIQTVIKGGFNMKTTFAYQDNQPLIERINEKLEGDELRNVMDFINFCYENDLPINANKKVDGWAVGGIDGRSIGFLHVHFGNETTWTLYSKHCDFETKYCDFDSEETKGLKDFVWKHVYYCRQEKCHDGYKKCGGYDGRYSETIFGKRFEKLCHSPLVFYSPSAEDLVNIKKLFKILADKHMSAIRKEMLK